MRRVVLFVLLVVFLPQATGAATIYLRDKTKIERAQIVGETANSFHITKKDGTYSIVYKYDTVQKADIFCIIDDSGALQFPESLRDFTGVAPHAADSLTAGDFQAALLRQQLDAQKEQTSGLKGLGAVALISALAAVSSSIALWAMYSQTK